MRELFEVLRRRWLWSLVAAVLVVAGSVAVFMSQAPTRTYSASLLLLPPKISQVTDPTSPDYTRSNPLFFLGTLGQARDILIGALTSKDVQTEIQETYPGVSYEAAQDVLGTGPIVILTVESVDEQAASEALGSLLTSANTELEKLQSDLGIRSSARITAHVLTRDESPTTSHKGQVRGALVAGGGLGLLSLFLIGVGDALLLRRRRGRSGGSGS